MNQEQQIQDYLSAQTNGWLEEDLVALDQEFLRKREEIAASLSAAIREICCQGHQLQEAGEKGAAAYLCISFLRTNIINDRWQYRIDLYDENFYLDIVECSIQWKMEFVWGALQKRLSILETVIHTGMYANKIRKHHMDRMKITIAESYHLIATAAMKSMIEEAIEIPEYARLVRGDPFQILMGEYRDQNILLYEEVSDL